MSLPQSVRIVEVGPRDGLQGEKPQSVANRVKLVELLADAGLRHIEAGSFVAPGRVPAMADSDKVFAELQRNSEIVYAALTPNRRGVEGALAANVDEVAIFTAASETFCQKNINCSIAESLDRFTPVLDAAKAAGVRVRGYVSCVMGCPYEGNIEPQKVATLTRELLDRGCFEVSLGDTIGLGTPVQAKQLFEKITAVAPMEQLAAHFHNTRGQAIANLYALLEEGLGVIDSAISGLGGCPYAPGASGNVATEDVVYLLNGLGIEHGISQDGLLQATRFVTEELGLPCRSAAGLAALAQANE
ncbi:hydroxymethylglutaryl-CoA lyase [Spongorhabdus nitratireducens]